ncbi:hypothetical protein CVT26_005892 [Gymnopilus dilepis]|uniref:Uncharacterized protein n=1 Tax=Gymnopilus dilepis TaxID=231916 RepID=A0A409Y1L1_9AGAR|nr:hypothetical protein CVT26_005892 [Gymnopilus dilepis]
MDPSHTPTSNGSDQHVLANLTSRWHRGVPWDDGMNEVSIEIPEFLIQLLRHNNPPTVEDVRLCQGYQDSLEGPLLSVQNRIQSILTQIAELQVKLQKLESERLGYDKQFFACEVACSPIRRLPQEIVQEIAAHLIIPRHNLLSARDSLVSMSHVCTGWRKALTSMPRLWARFGIETVKIARPHYQAQLEKAVLEYSARSHPFPLDIRISLADLEMPSTRHERSHQFLLWLICDWTSVDRVRQLHITSFRLLDILSEELRDPANFTSLERLALVSGRSTRPSMFRQFSENTDWGNLFMNAPKLQRLSVDNKTGEYFQGMHFPFHQITHLFLGSSLSFGSWTTLLSKLSALKLGWFSLHNEVPSTNVVWENHLLQHLTITLEDYEVYLLCANFIHDGYLPDMSHAEFVIPSSRAWYSRGSSVPSTPGVPLRHLSLFFNEESPVENILAILRNSPEVRTLELGLSASQWGRLLIDLKLNEQVHDEQVLPMLDTLVIQASVPTDTLSWKGTYFEGKICNELVEMVQSRTMPAGTRSTPLHTLYLLVVQHPDYQALVDDAETTLSSYREAGLSLVMRNLSESLEESRYHSCLDADWDIILPALPASYIPPKNNGPWI